MNLEAYQLISDTWKEQHSSDTLSDFNIHINQDPEASDEESQRLQNGREIQVIYCWRTSKLPISSIALKLNISKNVVKETVKKYTTLVKKITRRNIMERNIRRSVIDEDKLDQIKEF